MMMMHINQSVHRKNLIIESIVSRVIIHKMLISKNGNLRRSILKIICLQSTEKRRLILLLIRILIIGLTKLKGSVLSSTLTQILIYKISKSLQ